MQVNMNNSCFVFLLVLVAIERSTAFVFSRALANHRYGVYSINENTNHVSRVYSGLGTHYPHQLLNFIRAEEEEGEDEEGEEEEGEENSDDGDDAEENGSSTEESAPTVIPQGEDILSLVKEGIKFPTSLNGSDVRVGIIMARWNADIITGLYKGVNESLTQCGVKASNVYTTYVPGAFELPMTAKFLSASKRFDVIICLGCLIKGETMHFEYIAQATSTGIMQVALDSFTPVIFGVLTVMNKEQAIHRSVGTSNEGLSWGKAAVEMGLARMSAMGFNQQKKKTSSTQPYVTFNATVTDQQNGDKNKNGTATALPNPKRKIGF